MTRNRNLDNNKLVIKKVDNKKVEIDKVRNNKDEFFSMTSYNEIDQCFKNKDKFTDVIYMKSLYK